MSNLRYESDSLGSVPVPDGALYGAQTARAVENFPISGKTSDPALLRAYLRVKAASAIANRECGAIPAPVAELIIRATEQLLGTRDFEWARLFPVDVFQAGAGTSLNMNLNEVIANVANRFAGQALGSYHPVHPNDHVNRSQSTNDSFPTAMRLALLESGKALGDELSLLAQAFEAKSGAWMSIPKSARTHLQDAVPMRLGQEFGGYAITLKKCAAWITAARDTQRQLGIGGSAAGTGLTVPKGFLPLVLRELERLTGETLESAPNLFEAMQSQSPASYYSAMLRLCALELTRICNDLRLLASGPMTGLAEITLPAVQPGSSIMPGKVNPSILEMANQAWFSVLGHDQTVAFAVQAGQLELNVMMPVLANALLEATRVATNATRILRTRCVEGLEPNVIRLRRYFESTPQVATALSPRLGYEQTAKLVQESLALGKSVIELVRERGLLSDAELATLLDLDALTGKFGP